MTLRFLGAVLPFAVVLAGCSVSSSNDDKDDTGGGAVKNVPLEGVLDGQAFKAKSALVLKVQGAPNDRQVNIYAVDATCDKQPFDAPHKVAFRVKNWAPGLTYELDFDTIVTMTYKANASVFTINGRVEIAASGQSLGVRAINSETMQVEGTVPVTECL